MWSFVGDVWHGKKLTFSRLKCYENVISTDWCLQAKFTVHVTLQFRQCCFPLFSLTTAFNWIFPTFEIDGVEFSPMRNLHVRTWGKLINHAEDVLWIFYRSRKHSSWVVSVSACDTKRSWLKIKMNDIVSSDDEQFCLLCAELRSNWNEAKWWMTGNLRWVCKNKLSLFHFWPWKSKAQRDERFTRLDFWVVRCHFCFRCSATCR